MIPLDIAEVIIEALAKNNNTYIDPSPRIKHALHKESFMGKYD